MNKPEAAFTLEDIYNFLTNPSIDLQSQVLHINFLSQNFESFDDIFKTNYSIIIFIPSPTFDESLGHDNPNNIGHFTLLTNFDDKNIEFFDSFGKEPPSVIKNLCEKFDKHLITNNIQLQGNNTYICAKYCLSRMQSLPTPLKDYVKILKSADKLTPDYIINNLYNNKNERKND